MVAPALRKRVDAANGLSGKPALRSLAAEWIEVTDHLL
jgi:hypothetical protein